LIADDSTVVPRTAPAPDRRIIVPALGVTQILAWGSTFYLLAVLSRFIQKDTGWSYDLIVAGASIGLLFAGLLSPRVGRLIAERGGRPVLATGALLLAAGLAIIGLAPGAPSYLFGWAVAGLGMAASLYDAAFSTLGSIYGAQSRQPIAAITMIGGFASTVCWPLTALLAERIGWRGACLSYAAIQLAVSLPIHLIVLPRRPRTRRVGHSAGTGRLVRLHRHEYLVFGLLAASITTGAGILSIMGTHLLPILVARGMDMPAAVALGTIVGPSQVGARMIEALAGHHYNPVWTMVASIVLVAAAAWMLVLGLPLVGLAIVVYGAGNGIGSVARGTVPLALFGADRYPVLMGRLALPLLAAMAAAPYVGGLAFERGGAGAVLALLAGCATANLFFVTALRLLTARLSKARGE
jgi:MFS family permease